MNARFVNKGLLKSDYATLNALIKYFEKGGDITVVKPAKRPKRGYTVGKAIKVGDK